MDVNVILDEYEQSMNDLYPKYRKLTSNIFEKIKEMLLEDYDSISSDKKRSRVIKSYLYEIVQKAYQENGHKNYLKKVIGIFRDDDINKYLCKMLGSEREEYLSMMDGLKSSIIYWQGYEGNEEGKLNELLGWIK